MCKDCSEIIWKWVKKIGQVVIGIALVWAIACLSFIGMVGYSIVFHPEDWSLESIAGGR